MDGAARTLARRMRAQGLTGRPAAGVEQALGRLVGVQAQHLARWSGAGLRRARRAFELIAPELHEDAGGSLLTSSTARQSAAGGPQAALLGHFDPYLLGYASRDLVLDARSASRPAEG